MKSSYLLAALLISAAFSSCDNIGEDDRYIKEEKPVVDNPRNLLIMEFTGNKCVNCPNGALTVEKIKDDEEPGRVISVGLHPFGNSFTEPAVALYPTPHKQDFRSEAATVLYEWYDYGNAMPTAVFNGLRSSLSSSMQDWMQRASEALLLPARLTIDAKSSYDPEKRSAAVDYTIEFGHNVDTPLSATVWLVENDIKGTQTMPDGSNNYEYIHNHVLRTSLNGNWGESLGSSFGIEETIGKSARITLEEDWVAENCVLVIYVYQDATKEVEQSVQIPLIPQTTENQQ